MSTYSLRAAELVAHPERIGDVDPAAVPILLTQLVTVAAALAARATPASSPRSTNGPSDPHDLLTVTVAAKRLGIRPSFLYEAIRLGHVPAVKLGKYVRLQPAIVAEIQENGLDTGLSQRYISTRDRQGSPSAAGNANASGVRRPARRPREHARTVRAGRAFDSGATCPARPDPR